MFGQSEALDISLSQLLEMRPRLQLRQKLHLQRQDLLNEALKLSVVSEVKDSPELALSTLPQIKPRLQLQEQAYMRRRDVLNEDQEGLVGFAYEVGRLEAPVLFVILHKSCAPLLQHQSDLTSLVLLRVQMRQITIGTLLHVCCLLCCLYTQEA